MEKIKRKSMGYRNVKLVCSNCDYMSKGKDQTPCCNKIEEKNNRVQMYGTCRFHSAKILENILKKTRDGHIITKDETEIRDRTIFNKLLRTIFEEVDTDYQ